MPLGNFFFFFFCLIFTSAHATDGLKGTPIDKMTLSAFERCLGGLFGFGGKTKPPLSPGAAAPRRGSTADLVKLYQNPQPVMDRVRRSYALAEKRLGLPEGLTAFPEAQFAITHFVRGNDALGSKHVKLLFQQLEKEGIAMTPELRQHVGQTLADMAKNPSLARDLTSVNYRDNFSQEYPVELAMIKNHIEGTQNKLSISRHGQEMPLFNPTMQQMEMARTVMQYGNLKGAESSVLEIGYGNPSILAALQPLASKATVGIDILPLPKNVGPEKMRGVRLIQGNMTKDIEAGRAVAKQGPFNVVYGLDVFKSNVGYGEPFRPGVSNLDYLRSVHALLEDGGRFIMMNDFLTETQFSRAEAEAAGFKVVRWKSKRALTPAEKEFHANSSPGSNGGDMYLYVLQKGEAKEINFRAVDAH